MNKYLLKLRSFISSNSMIQKLIYPAYTQLIVPMVVKKRQSLMFKHARGLLESLDDAMSQAGVFYWLDCGTLLGVIREEGFLPGDLDVDVGIFIEDYNEDLHSQLVENGFKRRYEYIYKKNGPIEALQYTYEYKGIGVDLFFYHKSDNEMCYHFFMAAEKKSIDYTVKHYGGLFIIVECMPSSGFSKINFLGRTYNIPLDYDRHLSIMYGDDYMTPNPQWKCRLGDYKTLSGKFAEFTRFC